VPQVVYSPGTHTLTREEIGTRYVAMAVRTLVDPNSPGDIDEVHALQDAITVDQDGIGSFEVPDWDPASRAGRRPARQQGHVRYEGGHRSGATTDRGGNGMGRKSGEGRPLSDREPAG
jgi:hypothetical protein